ncbi:hypothetical protein NHX12_029947 [Muraenolepis orangiensis]|uniref:Uncharacterized protein n=1 Tax=Muraenolepis orangiensis TaxID=630683 RepID=A0A9Q0ILF6_9TELE|nr:hypothetical protein NHX12_029947 [Muraenolepis orangiensis]
MSRAPSRLFSVPAASRPTKPTFSFLWSALECGNTPPFRDLTMLQDPGRKAPEPGERDSTPRGRRIQDLGRETPEPGKRDTRTRGESVQNPGRETPEPEEKNSRTREEKPEPA